MKHKGNIVVDRVMLYIGRHININKTFSVILGHSHNHITLNIHILYITYTLKAVTTT